MLNKLTAEQQGYIQGIDKAIHIMDKYKVEHKILYLVIKELEICKQSEIKRIPY